MSRDKMQQTLIECLCAHQFFIRLGFKHEEVLLGLSCISPNYDEPLLGVILNAQGKEFVLGIGLRHGATDAEIRQDWDVLADNFNGGRAVRVINNYFPKSSVMLMAVDICQALITKGFVLPKESASPQGGFNPGRGMDA